MAIPGFFRQNKPRGFNYVPRYYDPQKEEWDQKRMARSMEKGARGMENEISGAVNPESKPYRSKIMRGSMKNYFPRNRERLQKQSMIRFIVILIIIAFVIYIYLRY
jgi:hypothetical protein